MWQKPRRVVIFDRIDRARVLAHVSRPLSCLWTGILIMVITLLISSFSLIGLPILDRGRLAPGDPAERWKR